jgi:hypothetical protein
MGQLTGVLALLLSENPVLPLNVIRYTTALTQAMNNLQPNDPAVLSRKIIVLYSNKRTKPLFQIYFEMLSMILIQLLKRLSHDRNPWTLKSKL